MPGLLTVGVPYVTEAFSARIGARAMGYYVSSLVVGGLVGRVGVALLTSAVGWRWALAAVALLPLVATLVMRRSLPPEPALPDRSTFSLRTIRGLLGNRALVAATLAGSASFGAFMGVFSYVDFRLEAPPFDALAGGHRARLRAVGHGGRRAAGGPPGGPRRLAARRGRRAGDRRGGLTLSLVPVLAVVIAGLALVTLGNFSCVTAAQLGVASATDRDRGLASAMYFSVYYLAGAIGGYVPGLAWEAWGWTGVWALAVAAQLTGMAAIAATRRRAVAR